MKRDFSHDETQRDNQQLSLAHIAVEKLMEERLAGETVDVYAPDFVCSRRCGFGARRSTPYRWTKGATWRRFA